MTQAALAERAEVAVSSLRNWEIDYREPGFRAVCQLAKALGVAVEVLGDTLPVGEAGRTARPAGPTKLAEVPPPAKAVKGGKAAAKGKAPRAKRKKGEA